jgi:membrane protein DedA with SNARE-associated domain
MNNHGIYGYLTKKEDNLLAVIPAISIGLFVGAGLIYYFALGERPRKLQPWEKRQF